MDGLVLFALEMEDERCDERVVLGFWWMERLVCMYMCIYGIGR